MEATTNKYGEEVNIATGKVCSECSQRVGIGHKYVVEKGFVVCVHCRPHSLQAWQQRAQDKANREGSSVIVFESLLAQGRPEKMYGIAYTLPTWGTRIGDRVYPK